MSVVSAYIPVVETDSEEETQDSILLREIITFVSRHVKRCSKKTILQVLRNHVAQKEKTTFFHTNETTGFGNATEVSEIRHQREIESSEIDKLRLQLKSMEKDREILRLKYENALVHHEKDIRTLNESIATAQSDNKKFKKWLKQLSKSSIQTNAQATHNIEEPNLPLTVEQSIQTETQSKDSKNQLCQTDEEKSIFKKKDDQIMNLRKQLENGQEDLLENQEILRNLRKIKLELEYGVDKYYNAYKIQRTRGDSLESRLHEIQNNPDYETLFRSMLPD
ncbi:Oidioi.mRNA.OKI2018_I69.chr2.g7546.t1.cds [Oikopleura dioica]|uniref:Oidioi.mRNA.OKI2018_I69.chr2.g7546.t1.cds n=1 Tax=Oikopleura dioica TaxID=34765 RepID=A0ABN7T6I2_OIKDI|nr:Oidioi.mRNA.OKI2018_I69.chr2.g7546.t1.cds [Oikopleura dioica]